MDIRTQTDIDEAVKLIGKKTSIDPNFRKSILNNLNKKIKEVPEKDIPEGFIIKIIENQSGIDQTYILPDFQSYELDDEELDAFAGGRCKHCTVELTVVFFRPNKNNFK